MIINKILDAALKVLSIATVFVLEKREVITEEQIVEEEASNQIEILDLIDRVEEILKNGRGQQED